MDETRRHPCPYPDCAEENSAKARFCSRCGRPLNIKAMRAAESWRGAWFAWAGVLIIAAPIMVMSIRRPTDYAPWFWMAIMVVGFAIATQAARRPPPHDQERLP